MTKKRILTLAAVGTLAAMSSVAISMTTWIGASAAPSQVRLHLGSDGDRFTNGSTTQSLTVGGSSCAINSAESLMHLQSTSSQLPPGLVGHSIGIKTGSTNGTPCGQVDSTESLTLSPVSELAGRSFTSLRMDLEVTGNAIVLVTLTGGSNSHTYTLQTGTSAKQQQKNESDYDPTAPFDVSSTDVDDIDACAAASNSSPNSGFNDNCRWLITPTFKFNVITLRTSSGAVSLEGSGDYLNDTNYDTLFTLAPPAPVANNDTVTTNEDTAAQINALANDTSGTGDALSVTGFISPSPSAHGGVVTRVGGTFTYSPPADFNGSDSFGYTITDGNGTASATVNITVTPVNDRPVAVSSNQTMAEDTSKTITVGTDVDSTKLTAACSGGPTGGSITDNLNGTITYAPPQNFNGTATITCTVSDDQGGTSSSSASIQVGVTPVNDAPVVQDDPANVNQNTSTQHADVTISVLSNDSDVDNDTLSVAVVADGAHGHAVANANGTITYTPTLDEDYSGPDTFTYKASDGHGGLSNTATVTVTINQVMCSRVPVPTGTIGNVYATFELRSLGICKPYSLSSDQEAATVTFQPVGDLQVDYRANISLGTKTLVLNDGSVQVGLQYDPDGDGTAEGYRAVPPCDSPQYDEATGELIGATPPAPDTWCFAGVTTKVLDDGQALSTWLVWGHDDPNFK